jgi:hypothetical protein
VEGEEDGELFAHLHIVEELLQPFGAVMLVHQPLSTDEQIGPGLRKSYGKRVGLTHDCNGVRSHRLVMISRLNPHFVRAG